MNFHLSVKGDLMMATAEKIDIRIKRVYDPPEKGDGDRILVDRLWPRGLSKEKAKIDFWHKEIAPSDDLRRWYGHDPDKWEEFKARYFEELDQRQDLFQQLLDKVKGKKVTFAYSSKEEKLNNAAALEEYIRSRAEK